MAITDELSLPRLSQHSQQHYQDAGVWGEETFADLFAETLSTYPERTVVGPKRTVTYSELDEEAAAISAGLQQLGIQPGDVISYQLPNWVSTVTLYLAITRLGVIGNPIIPIYREREVEYILQDSGATVMVVPDRFRDFDYPSLIDQVAPTCPELDHAIVLGDSKVESIRTTSFTDLQETSPTEFEQPSFTANDIHLLLYTSGTTADPKGVLHTHNTMLYESTVLNQLMGLSDETTMFMPSPVTHVTGTLFALEMPFLEGMSLVLLDQWNPTEAVQLIDDYHCNVTVGATPFLQGIYDEAPDSWECPIRVFGCGGAEVPPGLVRAASSALHCTVMRVYGSTEFPTVTWAPLDAPLDKRAETDGRPAPGVEVKIVDLDSREEVPVGEQGELICHGPELMVGYVGNDLTTDAFTDKWFKTGDVVVMDEDGYLEVVGRVKDIIIRGGENIPVKDVEDLLYEHPAVQDVAVVAMPDPVMQEKGCAYVVEADGHSFTFEDMIEYLEGQGIAKQKFPERLEIVSEFPMTASGKIQKNILRKDIAEKIGHDPVQR